MNRIAVAIAVGLALWFPGAAQCADAPAGEPLKKVPVQITADKLDYDRAADVYVAVGHVRIEQETMRVEADRIVFNNKTGEAVAEGNVYLRDKGDTLMAEKLEFNLAGRSGVIHRGELFMAKDNYHFKGERIERTSETTYRVENGSFTTCDQGEWALEARSIDVDMNRYASGRGVSFTMGGVPVFYTPYLLFPVRRQSGLLIPEAGYSSTEGLLLKNSIFWAISDRADMTFFSDYRDRKGHGTGIEYRYVNSRDSSGKAFYNYFDTFDSTVRRWTAEFQHREEFADDLSFRADVRLVSDELYFRDIEKNLDLRSRPYLDSNVFYLERWDTAALYLLGQYSTDLTRKNDATIQKAPELRYMIFGEPVGRLLHFNFEGSAANFVVKEGNNVNRADFRPELTAVVSGMGLSFTPRIGARATLYDRGETSTEPVERKYTYAGADLNARFSRVFGNDADRGFGRIRHSIEPTVTYSYIPSVEQGDAPQLDAVDLVAEENLVVFSLINRLTAHYKDAAGFRTFDVMVFRLSEAYDVNEARRPVTVGAPARPRKEISAELAVKTPSLLSLSASGTYNPYTDQVSASSESVTIRGSVVEAEVSHRYLRDPRTEFLIGGAGLTLGSWKLNGKVWRDLENRNTTQQEYLAHYASQCWGLGLSYVIKPGETQVLLVLDLKGLGAMKF